MSLGIECLITDDEARAANCAQELERLNRERRGIEASMLQQALLAIERVSSSEGCTFFHPDWHQGVVGIVASRLKDRLHRPVICFARAEEAGEIVLRGSGRSIPGLHLRDALDAMHFSLEVARLLDAGIWGQGFPQPLFCDTFIVENQRVVGERHLKLWLVKGGRRMEAMRYGALDPLPPQVRAAYRLSVNEFNGLKNIQLNVEHYE